MRSTIRPLSANLLILLFAYAAVSKLADLHAFRGQLHNQPIPKTIADVLLIAIPLTEIAAIALLSVNRTVQKGLILSFVLLSVFTLYIGLALTHFWSRMPCSCGGVLSQMGWGTHFIFNLFFLILCGLALYLPEPKR